MARGWEQATESQLTFGSVLTSCVTARLSCIVTQETIGQHGTSLTNLNGILAVAIVLQ
jgi:hypothetical protein